MGDESGKLIAEYRKLADRVEVVRLDWKTVGKGMWGTWGYSWQAREGYMACGVRVRSEPKQGDSDDTGMNSIRFKYCSVKSHKREYWGASSSSGGYWGTWDSSECMQGYFISDIDIRIEGSQGDSDDTAAN